MTAQAAHFKAPDKTQRRPLTVGPKAMARTVAVNAADAGYRSGYHVIRWIFQIYPARAALTFPQGVWWCVATWWPWVRDVEGREVARIAAQTVVRTRRGAGAMSAQAARHDRHVKTRWAGSIAAGFAVALAGWFISQVLGWFGWLTLAYALIILIGYQGRDRTQRWTDEAASGLKQPTIDVQLLARVLSSIGISDLTKALRDPETKEPSAANLEVRASRTPSGDGQLIEVVLPIGVTAQMLMQDDRPHRIASGFRRADDQVFLESGEAHSGLVLITILDRPASQTPPPTWIWPREVDIFEPLPVGFTPSGDLISMRLMFQTLLIGAAPDAGKTWSIRALATTIQWDPRVQLFISEMKGTGDLACLKQRCRFYRSGNDDEDLTATSRMLKYLKTELRRRQRVLGVLAEEQLERVPENKMTPELAVDPDLDMPVIVVVLDEFHELSESASLEHRKAFTEMVDVARQARAVGIILLLATQRPDAEAISTRLRDMLTYRLGLRCLSRDASNMVLGDGMAKLGYDCTALTPAQQGTGWLRADKGEPQLVRWAAVSPAESLAEVQAAMSWHGIPPMGHGPGELDPAGGEPDTDDRAVIDFVAEVLTSDDEIVATAELVRRLEARWPAKFTGWSNTRLSRSLNRSHRLTTADRRVDGQQLKTLTRNEILAAAGHQLEESTQ